MSARTRTYGQQCGLAASLDLLGERWTLLIVRELARGPKRFRDLLDGLEGIGTNLLSSRLKSLEGAGVVERINLPAPASVAAYDLGERGRSLLPILEELALWGFSLIEREEGEAVTSRAAWVAMTMKARMDRSDRIPPDGLYAFEVGPEQFWLRISEGKSVLRDGPPPFDADVRLNASKESFFEIASEASADNGQAVAVSGDRDRLEALLQTFRLPGVPD